MIYGDSMLDEIKNGGLVITLNNIKIKLLKEMTLKKVLMNVKFMTLKQFKEVYFGTYDERAIYYLMNEYQLNYDVARLYLDNIFYDVPFLKEYYENLDKNKLLIYDDNFKKSLKDIVVIGYEDVDDYVKKELNKYNVTYVTSEEGSYTSTIYGFDTQTDEITYIATDILKRLKDIDISNIYLVNVTDDYKNEIRNIFDMFNIPVNLDGSKSIYTTETVQIFLKQLRQNKTVEKSLENLPKNDIYNKIIDILNKYTFIDEVNETFIQIMKVELKKATIPVDLVDKAINLANLEDISDDGFYYVLGFNQGVIPKVYHDDDLIKDSLKEKQGLKTSLEKFLLEKEKVKKIIHSFNNLLITYKNRDNYSSYYPSPLISELNLQVIMNPEIKLNYSNKFNRHYLGLLLDKYIKYNEKSPLLNDLLITYNDIPYQTYDNKYTNIDFNDLKDYLKGKLNLSYSSMNNYFLCAFRFYISNILKLEPYEESFAALIGSLFHDCLSKMYTPNFDLKKAYQEFLQDKELSNKEKFFTEKLYKNLEFIIETIRYQESFSKFDQVLTEQRIMVDKSSKLQINFVGIVDKIKYMEENGKTLLAIIDYKTGALETNLDNINYGLHMQLPVYIYLTKNGIHKNIEVAGFYLQKILNNVDMDAKDAEAEMRKKLRLDGYSTSNMELLSLFDSSYVSSEVIKGMGTKSDGDFTHYAKVVNDEEINKISALADEKINEVIKAIENTNFNINPKRIKDEVVGCKFCKFKDLCFRKEEDIWDLKLAVFKEIVGDDNA